MNPTNNPSATGAATTTTTMTTATIKAERCDDEKKPLICAKCSQVIHDRFYMQVMDRCWHDQCLRCDYCACQLGDAFNQTLFTRDQRVLCKTDYMRIYGSGKCAACHTQIPAFEMVMRARQNVYHLECFACQDCSHRFCVGDRFYMFDNRVLCGPDYAERSRSANSENCAQLGQRENIERNGGGGLKRKLQPSGGVEAIGKIQQQQMPQQQLSQQQQMPPQQQQHQQMPQHQMLNQQQQQQQHQMQLQQQSKRRHLDMMPSSVAVR